MENSRHSLPEQAGNWLKGTLVRAYTAQRDHFLELHARRGGAPFHSRPEQPPKGKGPIRQEPHPKIVDG